MCHSFANALCFSKLPRFTHGYSSPIKPAAVGLGHKPLLLCKNPSLYSSVSQCIGSKSVVGWLAQKANAVRNLLRLGCACSGVSFPHVQFKCKICSLERAVAVLKAAPMGRIRIGIAKPIPIDQVSSVQSSYSLRFSAEGENGASGAALPHSSCTCRDKLDLEATLTALLPFRSEYLANRNTSCGVLRNP